MALEDIINYMQISGRIASSGQPDEYQFKEIAKAGYEVVINLAMPNSDNAISDEGYIVSARKMSYIHIPVPFEAPTIEHLKLFINVMKATSNNKVWIHCVVNKRASAFLYQYQRHIEGKSHEEAKEVILPTWKPNEVWRKFMGLSLDG